MQVPPTLGNLTALVQLRLKDNSISGTLPDSVRSNESWPESHGVQGAGGEGVPSELGVSQVPLGLGLSSPFDFRALHSG